MSHTKTLKNTDNFYMLRPLVSPHPTTGELVEFVEEPAIFKGKPWKLREA